MTVHHSVRARLDWENLETRQMLDAKMTALPVVSSVAAQVGTLHTRPVQIDHSVAAQNQTAASALRAVTPALSTKTVRVEWGPLLDYFKILSYRTEVRKFQDALGHYHQFRVLSLFVESKAYTVSPPILFAHYYDVNGVEARTPSMVEFEPALISLQPGSRYYAHVKLPDLSAVAVIKFTQL